MTGNVRFFFGRWLFFYTYAMMTKRGDCHDMEETSKKISDVADIGSGVFDFGDTLRYIAVWKLG